MIKKSRKNISDVLRNAIWETFLGIGIKQAVCPMCGITKIYKNTNSGFECCHIVAFKYSNDEDVSVLYYIPGCSICNNECKDLCILDFIYGRGRIKQLKNIMLIIYDTFVMLHGDELNQHDNMAWKVLDYLYGPKRYPIGGGIQNRQQIYEMIRLEQYKRLVKRASELALEMEINSKRMEDLMNSDIKTLNFV